VKGRFRPAWALGCGVGLVVVAVWSLLYAVDNATTPPATPGPTLPAYLQAVVVELDGQRYRCLVSYNEHGVDCDWDHPLQPTPTPTPTPAPASSRTDR